MSATTIKPGDLVVFDFWSTYLAPAACTNCYDKPVWYELKPGDRGLVIAVGSNGCDTCTKDDTVTVMFSRVNKLLLVHLHQLKPVPATS